jgi:hypothetical protein
LRAEQADWLDLLEVLIRSPEDCYCFHSDTGQGAGSWSWLPDAIFRHNQLALARRYQEELLPPFGALDGALDVSLVNEWIERQEEREMGFSDMLHVFTWGGSPGGRVGLVFAETQAWVVMARLACALERHRLATGAYPTELTALVPTFLQTIPPDPAGGGELHSRRSDEGRFVLYSVGRNGRDDGGNLVWTERGSVNTRDPDCDWVWTYPAEPSVEGR